MNLISFATPLSLLDDSRKLCRIKMLKLFETSSDDESKKNHLIGLLSI
jgi:hypothetical protein